MSLLHYVTYLLVPLSLTTLLAGILKACMLLADTATRAVLEMLVKLALRIAGLCILLVVVWLTFFVDR